MTAEVLQPVLDRVAAAVPYLRASIGAYPEDGRWFRCRDMAANRTLMVSMIRTTARGRGTTDMAVSASLFVQAYAFRVGGTAAACLAVSGIRPKLDPTSMAIGLARSRPSNIAYMDPVVDPSPDGCGTPGDSPAPPGDSAAWTRFGEDLVAHLTPFFETIRSVTPVGERLLWGNTVAAVASALRAVEGALGPELRAAGDLFLATAPEELRDLGSFIVLEGPAGDGWFWERTNCCLYDQVADASPCADCSRLSTEERRKGFLATLEVT